MPFTEEKTPCPLQNAKFQVCIWTYAYTSARTTCRVRKITLCTCKRKTKLLTCNCNLLTCNLSFKHCIFHCFLYALRGFCIKHFANVVLLLSLLFDLTCLSLKSNPAFNLSSVAFDNKNKEYLQGIVSITTISHHLHYRWLHVSRRSVLQTVT